MTRAAPRASTHAGPPTRSAVALPSSCGIKAAPAQEGRFLDPGRRRTSASLEAVSTLRRCSAPPFISQPKSKEPVPKVSHQNRGGVKIQFVLTLWQVEYTFRDLKSTFETRPVFHQRDETIRGHVFCSFLALVLRKALHRKLEEAGHAFAWAEIKQDLDALQVTILDENGKRLAVRTEGQPVPGNLRQSLPGGRGSASSDHSRTLITQKKTIR